MKKICTLVLTVTMLLNLSSGVLASPEISPSEELSMADKAGLTSASVFYPLDKFIDELKLRLTKDEMGRIVILTQIAEERLAESEVLTEKEKNDLAEKSVEEFNNKMTEATESLEDIITDTTENTTENATESTVVTDKETNIDDKKVDELTDKLAKCQKNSIEVLKKLETKLGDNAQAAIAKVIEMQTAKQEAVKNMVKERHELNTAKKDYNKAKIELKKIEHNGDEASIKAAEEILNEKNAQLQTAKEEYSKAFTDKKNAVKNLNTTVKKELKDVAPTYNDKHKNDDKQNKSKDTKVDTNKSYKNKFHKNDSKDK